MNYYIAIDIGASSGRHIVGWMDNGELKTEEVFRFPNGVRELDGHLVWDIDSLEANVVAGIDAARKKYPEISCISIDTWGVDYVLLKGDERVEPVYSYRDSRTVPYVDEVHSIVPFEELYAHTGIQYQPFNTIYQLYCDKQSGRLDGVTDFLMIPEYLMYRLTGVKKHEYTNATTGGFVNANSKTYDIEILKKLGLPGKLFGEISMPGDKVGEYKGIPVVLCATHDTGSAVEGLEVPKDAMFLSSGTWSLLGVKIENADTREKAMHANFTNEGGVGYIRFLKNIMGLWIIQNIQKELNITFPEMVQLAKSSSYEKTFDVNLPCFLEPYGIRGEILRELGENELSDADLINSVYRSLALSYDKAIKELEDITGREWKTLYIGGGGAKNEYLNELTAAFTGKNVIALPIEATAIGNLMVQMRAING